MTSFFFNFHGESIPLPPPPTGAHDCFDAFMIYVMTKVVLDSLIKTLNVFEALHAASVEAQLRIRQIVVLIVVVCLSSSSRWLLASHQQRHVDVSVLCDVIVISRRRSG